LKIIKNDNAERIIRAIIPKEILDLNPIIAGGFIVSIYNDIIKNSSYEFDNDILIKLNEYLDFNGLNSEIDRRYKIEKILSGRFGDIDLWFDNNNTIWKDGVSESALLANYYPDHLMGKLPEETSWNFKFNTEYVDRLNFLKSTCKLAERIDLSYYGLKSKINKASGWANTFSLDKFSYEIQFIKKPFFSPKELFNNFDIINCCAAYYDGKFYFHDYFMDLYDIGEIRVNLNFDEMSILRNMFITSRVFKYASRYNLEPDKSLCYGIFKTYIGAVDLKDRIDRGDIKEDKLDIDNYLKEDPYGRITTTIHKINSGVNELFKNFEKFTKFKNYDDVYSVYFVATEIYEIKSVIQKLMYIDK
jgi:hypothetical protein